MWTWSNFLHAHVAPGLRPLRINFDETAVRYFQEARQGHLTEKAKRLRGTPRSLTRPAPKGETRAMMSLAAFVCDDAEVQPLLPQVLVANKRLLTQAEMVEAMAALPAGVHIWREEKAWTTSEIMIRLLTTLRRSLEPVLQTRKVILSADAFRAHMTKPVFRAAAHLGFFYLLVPSKMTWALQPLDTHVFAVFKRRLSEAAQAAALASAAGVLTRPQLIGCVGRTVESVLRRRSWSRAFADCGLAGTQATVSARTLGKLGLVSPPPSGRQPPSLQMLRDIFPVRADIPIDDVFRAFLPPSGDRCPPRRRTSAPAPAPLEDPDPRAPWKGRLRSSSALSLGAAEPVAPERPCPPAPPPPSQEAPPPLTAGRRPPMPRPRFAVGRPLFRLPLPPPPPTSSTPTGHHPGAASSSSTSRA